MPKQPHTRDDIIPKCRCGQRRVAIKYGDRWLCMICAVEQAQKESEKRLDGPAGRG